MLICVWDNVMLVMTMMCSGPAFGSQSTLKHCSAVSCSECCNRHVVKSASDSHSAFIRWAATGRIWQSRSPNAWLQWSSSDTCTGAWIGQRCCRASCNTQLVCCRGSYNVYVCSVIFYYHYPLAGTVSHELEDFVGMKFHCPRALASGNWLTQIRWKIPEQGYPIFLFVGSNGQFLMRLQAWLPPLATGMPD